MNLLTLKSKYGLALHFLILAILTIAYSGSANSENLSISDKSRQLKPFQPDTPVINFDPNVGESHAIGSNMLFFEDKLHTKKVNQILRETVQWKNIERTSPNFGFTNTAYWFKFTINNTNSETVESYLEIPIPFLDSIQIYQIDGTNVKQQYIAGDMYPFDQRPIIHQNFVFPFQLASGSNDFIMRVASAGTVEAPILIWNPVDHAKASADDKMVQGFWAGMIGIMVVYNLLLFFSIRDISYLYYVVFAFGYLFFQISLKGYGFSYFWPEMLIWNSYAISTFIALCNLSVVMLVISFLNLKTSNPKAFRVMSILAIFSATLLLSTFIIPYSVTIRLTSATTLITCSLSLILGYVALFKGQEDARYYCLAWTATFIGIGVLGAVKFGIFNANFWTNNAGQIGVMFLVSLLSLALANRINREKELRIIAQDSALKSETLARQSQEELLEVQTSINAKLEQKVNERTKSMQKALNELEQVNNRLELASTTDALTTLFNRRHFENRLNIEFKRAQRHQRDLSLILCDIDHFKSINDNFGHKVGDECLRHISVILKNTITRSGDIISRYGGEEFIILLVDTPLKEAEYLAGILCNQFQESVFESNGDIIAVTASFGVTSLSQSTVSSADKLVNQADIAMYQAKNKGRNQVKTWQPESKSE